MDNALASHAWLAGDGYTIADAAFTPYIVRLEHLDMMGLLDRTPTHGRLVSPDQGPAELPSRHRAMGERRLPRSDETRGPRKLA
jgi:glutathione S-transferase